MSPAGIGFTGNDRPDFNLLDDRTVDRFALIELFLFQQFRAIR